MKTPLDVYQNLELILGHIDDLKIRLGITSVAPSAAGHYFEKKPVEVFSELATAFALLNEISTGCGCGLVDIPDLPETVFPRDIFQGTRKLIQHLSIIKRRLGAVDRAIPPETSPIRISPSLVYGQTLRINHELRIIKDCLRSQKKTA